MKSERIELAALAAVNGPDTIASAEQTRWTLWEAISLHDRIRAVAVAGLPKERATAPLASFTDEERQRVAFGIAAHVSRMEVIAKLMVMAKTNISGYLH